MRFLRVALFAAVAASVALAGVQAKDAAAEDLSLESVLSSAGLSTHPTVSEDEYHSAAANGGIDFALLENEVNAGLKHAGEGEGEHEHEAEHEASVDAETEAKVQQEAEHEALQEVDVEAGLEKELNEGLENAVKSVDDVNLIQTSEKAQGEAEAEGEAEVEGEAEAEGEAEGEAEQEGEAEAEAEGEAEAEAEAEIEPSLLQKDDTVQEALKKVDEADEVVSLVEQQSESAMKSIAQMEHEARMNHLRAAHAVQMQRHSELLEKHKQLLAKHEREHSELLKQQELSLIQQAEKLHLNNPDILLDPLLKVKTADEKIEIQSALKQVGLDDQSEAEREMNQHLALLEQAHKATIAANVAAARNAAKPSHADRQRVLAEREHARQAKLKSFENREYIPAQARAEHDAAHAEQDEADYLASRIHH